ncbi:sigma-70 family RNA polymerase sigma factor [Pirellulales bacterium]|nr:sigma-70 family RNA polymerase sigma factor [Pirellulales bacterium]
MDTDQLLDRVAEGESSAVATLLTRHRDRLRRMIQLRIDPRLAARMDPSDIVQDALTEAHGLLADYASTRTIPFYPWLRQIAWEKLVVMHRRHIDAQRRTVTREDGPLRLSDDSEMLLAERLAAVSAPSDQLLRTELCGRVRRTIAELPPSDREVIVLRHLEELSPKETAAVLDITEAALYSRYYRAINRLHRSLREG